MRLNSVSRREPSGSSGSGETSTFAATQRTDTGIGLSVVHQIIEDHGGTIRVESGVGDGTTFWVTLPIHLKASPLE